MVYLAELQVSITVHFGVSKFVLLPIFDSEFSNKTGSSVTFQLS